MHSLQRAQVLRVVAAGVEMIQRLRHIMVRYERPILNAGFTLVLNFQSADKNWIGLLAARQVSVVYHMTESALARSIGVKFGDNAYDDGPTHFHENVD